MAPADFHVVLTIQFLDPDVADVTDVDLWMGLAKTHQLGRQPACIGFELQLHVFAFAVLILVLLFKPAGLLGEAVSEETTVAKKDY